MLNPAAMTKSNDLVRLCLVFTPLLSVAAGAADLRIEVLGGAGANNNAESGITVSPLIRVVDEAGKPVPRALVVFAAPSSGPSVEFAEHGLVAQVFSDNLGMAGAPQVHPVVADGEVEIRITVTKDGHSASTSVFQMNLGVGKRGDPVDGLEIVMIPASGEMNPPRPDGFQSPRLVRFRVEGESGKPVPGVEVEITVQAVKGPGKSRELDRYKQVSASNGQILAVIPRHTGNDPLEIVLRAGWNGRSATRYFKLER
jgi:hypothetical protein